MDLTRDEIGQTRLVPILIRRRQGNAHGKPATTGADLSTGKKVIAFLTSFVGGIVLSLVFLFPAQTPCQLAGSTDVFTSYESKISLHVYMTAGQNEAPPACTDILGLNPGGKVGIDNPLEDGSGIGIILALVVGAMVFVMTGRVDT